MLLKRRLGITLACAGVLVAAGLLLTQSHAQATKAFNYSHLNKIQRRIISQTLASELAPIPAQRSNGNVQHNFVPGGDEVGGGADGAPNALPSSFGGGGGGSGALGNYVPSPRM